MKTVDDFTGCSSVLEFEQLGIFRAPIRKNVVVLYCGINSFIDFLNNKDTNPLLQDKNSIIVDWRKANNEKIDELITTSPNDIQVIKEKHPNIKIISNKDFTDGNYMEIDYSVGNPPYGSKYLIPALLSIYKNLKNNGRMQVIVPPTVLFGGYSDQKYLDWLTILEENLTDVKLYNTTNIFGDTVNLRGEIIAIISLQKIIEKHNSIKSIQYISGETYYNTKAKYIKHAQINPKFYEWVDMNILPQTETDGSFHDLITENIDEATIGIPQHTGDNNKPTIVFGSTMPNTKGYSIGLKIDGMDQKKLKAYTETKFIRALASVYKTSKRIYKMAAKSEKTTKYKGELSAIPMPTPYLLSLDNTGLYKHFNVPEQWQKEIEDNFEDYNVMFPKNTDKW